LCRLLPVSPFGLCIEQTKIGHEMTAVILKRVSTDR
jgi:hypothetical protein